MPIRNNFSPTPQSNNQSQSTHQQTTTTAAAPNMRMQYNSDSPELSHQINSAEHIKGIDLTQSNIQQTNKPSIPVQQSNHNKSNDILSPSAAIQKYRHCMTSYELGEILQYKSVYYCGQNITTNQKIHGTPHATNNYGYDDNEHELYIVTGDQLEYRYEIIGLLGRGVSYVCIHI